MKYQELVDVYSALEATTKRLEKTDIIAEYLKKLDADTIASMIYFFQLAAAYSGLLFGINPFNQPGVEVYKNEVRESLGK